MAQLSKFREGGGLGISLEGTVDIDESGEEVRPHHYIRSILVDGPVGQNGRLKSGDELLEVNRHSHYNVLIILCCFVYCILKFLKILLGQDSNFPTLLFKKNSR